MSEIRVRFAPSPTGMFHVGSARTALFNWLYARHTGGVFVLRIEDTDASRNTPEAMATIFDSLQWLGLDWDEGPQADGSEKGDRGPYRQSQRGEIYQRYIEKLLTAGSAYEDEGAVRFRSPKTPCLIEDAICGEVRFDRANDPDFVIRRSDGSPVFHLVNVVDDMEMGINVVIRGEDHLSNTPKHMALFEAFGGEAPKYAHIPLILNPGGSKMSKRDEGAGMAHYIDEGFLPEAVVNFLSLLGWSPKDDRDILSRNELVERFDLPQINRSNAKFDLTKLVWMNGEYWRAMPPAEHRGTARAILKAHGALPEGCQGDYLDRVLDLVQEKIKVGRELVDWVQPFLNEAFEYDPASVEKVAKQEDWVERVRQLRAAYEGTESFTAEKLEEVLKKVAEEAGEKVKVFVHPCRLAVSGRSVGPSLYHMLEVMGKDRVLSRMQRTIDKVW